MAGVTFVGTAFGGDGVGATWAVQDRLLKVWLFGKGGESGFIRRLRCVMSLEGDSNEAVECDLGRLLLVSDGSREVAT